MRLLLAKHRVVRPRHRVLRTKHHPMAHLKHEKAGAETSEEAIEGSGMHHGSNLDKLRSSLANMHIGHKKKYVYF